MPKVVIFNGPPRSGKDAMVDHLVQVVPNSFKYKFTAPMDRAIKAFLAVTDEQYKELREDRKDEVFLNDRTFRQALIGISEDWAKPQFGTGIFGLLFLTHCYKNMGLDQVVFISDGGFKNELAPIEEVVPEEDLLLIRVHREGFDFEGDSRDYIERDSGITVNVHNNGTLEELHQQIENVITLWLDECTSSE